jgi:simple sugar transport system permease protein
VGIALGALLWAFMDVARTPMSRADLPREITTIMQGVIVLSVVIAYSVVAQARRRHDAATLARPVHDDAPPTEPRPPEAVPA